MATISELTGLTPEQIDAAKARVLAGDLTPVKEMLFDSALLLYSAAIAAVNSAKTSSYPSRHIGSAVNAVESCKRIFETLAEHTTTENFTGIASTLFQENLEKIMRYLARKGGAVKRYELLTSRVIKGVALDYDKHLAALIDSGYIAATPSGQRKEIVYSLIMISDQPLIEVLGDGG